MNWFVKCFKKPNVDEFLTDIKIIEDAVPVVKEVLDEFLTVAVKVVVPVVKEVLDEIEG